MRTGFACLFIATIFALGSSSGAGSGNEPGLTANPNRSALLGEGGASATEEKKCDKHEEKQKEEEKKKKEEEKEKEKNKQHKA